MRVNKKHIRTDKDVQRYIRKVMRNDPEYQAIAKSVNLNQRKRLEAVYRLGVISGLECKFMIDAVQEDDLYCITFSNPCDYLLGGRKKGQ